MTDAAHGSVSRLAGTATRSGSLFRAGGDPSPEMQRLPAAEAGSVAVALRRRQLGSYLTLLRRLLTSEQAGWIEGNTTLLAARFAAGRFFVSVLLGSAAGIVRQPQISMSD